ncbi:MAG: hypothetical protein ACYC33_11855 [Thermoleophilia bacterium]
MNGPLDVAIVWHMHQPYYKTSDSGAFEMPWVRMHAVKDYAEMVEILEGYPRLHQTFNLVPSLVEQLLEYATGGYLDTYEEHTRKPAAELTPSERSFLLGVICERTSHPRARRYPRYLELAQKRDRCTKDGSVRVEEFTEAELRDVQVLFDLAWFHPVHLKRSPLAGLSERGRDFTEEDKEAIRAEQTALLGRIVPTYRAAAATGRVELTTSPYFHPILPLLINSDLARVSLPNVELPTRRFEHQEDADEQIREALRLHIEVFGEPPRGMWCSEQSVGEDVIAPLSRHGLEWTVSDEAVLARSLGLSLQRDADGALSDPSSLYSAYRLEREHGALDIVFRDRVLSDLVGFTYQDWDPKDAAADLLGRLRRARRDLPPDDASHLVTIALDGENAWEYYRNEGRDFLERLYEGLQQDTSLRCVTISEHLADSVPKRRIPWLHTGSWIGGDLGTWVGDRAHRPAWDLLHDARDAVATVRERVGISRESRPEARLLTRAQDPVQAPVQAPVLAPGETPAETPAETPVLAPGETPGETPAETPVLAPDIRAAWREILVAEGSDWFWWFGDHQESGLDEVWDAAFRRHLQQAYRLAGLIPPSTLFTPILGQAPGGPTGLMDPTVDGRLTTPDEWDQGIALRRAGGGAMQRSEGSPILDLRFGWSREALFFLVVPGSPHLEGPVDVAFYLGIAAEAESDRAVAGGGAAPAEADALAARLGFRPEHRLLLRLTRQDDGLSANVTLSGPPFGETAPSAPSASFPSDPAPASESDASAPQGLVLAAGAIVEVEIPRVALGTRRFEALLVGAVLSAHDRIVDTFPSTGVRVTPVPRPSAY